MLVVAATPFGRIRSSVTTSPLARCSIRKMISLSCGFVPKVDRVGFTFQVPKACCDQQSEAADASTTRTRVERSIHFISFSGP
jgi:hypothetical protein